MIRYLADASLNHHIVLGCLRREPAMDFRSAVAADLAAMPDPRVLALAAREGRIVVTHDVHTMPLHFGEFLLAGGRSPGVFMISQRVAVATAVEALVLIWAASDAKEWENRILEVPL